MQTEWQTVYIVDPDPTGPVGAVWSGLEEQSDLGLRCLPRPVCLKT